LILIAGDANGKEKGYFSQKRNGRKRKKTASILLRIVGFEVKHMTIRELTENLDVNTPLYIGLADSEKVVFRRKHASDVIPESLLNMEVGSVFNEFNSLYIYVQRNSRKGSFRELLNYLHGYEYIDVYVANRDGAKGNVYSGRVVFCTNYKYANYIVKKISLHQVEWGSKIGIVIEPCEEEDTQEGE
jgi:hypothetical protein